MTSSNLHNKMHLQWQVGDWHKLCQYSKEDLQQQNTNADMALMSAVAWLQLGDTEQAKQCIMWSQEWGASKALLAKYLLSSLDNTLGLANLTLDLNSEKAIQHLQDTLELGCDDTDIDIALSYRLAQQKHFIELNAYPNTTKPVVKQLNKIELGEAWAGNTVNTVIFRHHGLLTVNNIQITAFYVDSQTLRIAERSLVDNSIQNYDLMGEYNLKDAHNSISLAADREGHLHISYDHHGTRLKYRRSLQPMDISAWSDELSMTGKNEEKVTYPTFIMPVNDNPLLILYRDGNWKQGTAYLKYYDETLQAWIDYPHPILSGADQKPWTSNAYWNHPVTDMDGNLLLSFCWRTDYFSEEKLISNINIDYAKSYDGGYHWYTSKDQQYNLPITQVTSETVWPISSGSNLINQTSMALDSQGYPHIVFYANDEHGIPQYQHVWFNGLIWQQTYASNRKETFTLSGGGTLQIPISRPDLVIDEHDNVYVIHSGQEIQHKMAATFLPAPHYELDEKNTQILHDETIGHAEPIIDHLRWQQEKVLSLLIQNNAQPNGDIGHQDINKPVSIVDIQFTNS